MKIDYHHFTTIDSTNTWAKQHAEAFDPQALTVISADHQTSGQGRAGRKWLSPANQNIYVTFSLCIDKQKKDAATLSHILALCCKEVIEEEGITAELKWPNDILVKGKKISGILGGAVFLEESVIIYVGIGLNVNMPLSNLEEIDQPATSLFAIDSIERPRNLLLSKLVKKFNFASLLFKDKGFTPFFEEYRRALLHREGDPLAVRLATRRTEGQFHKIESDGSLILKLVNGDYQSFSSGDLILDQ